MLRKWMFITLSSLVIWVLLKQQMDIIDLERGLLHLRDSTCRPLGSSKRHCLLSKWKRQWRIHFSRQRLKRWKQLLRRWIIPEKGWQTIPWLGGNNGWMLFGLTLICWPPLLRGQPAWSILITTSSVRSLKRLTYMSETTYPPWIEPTWQSLNTKIPISHKPCTRRMTQSESIS